MNDIERNRTVNWIVTITVGLVVAALVGILFGFLGAKLHFRNEPGKMMNPTGKAGGGRQYVAVLSYNGGNCTQTVNGQSDAIVHLSISNGDTIEWSPRNAVTSVTFAGTAPSGPFESTSYKGTSGYVGPSQDAQLGDNFFKDVMVGGQRCNNAQYMGVHVDQ